MKKDFLKMVAVMLPILFLFFVSISYALNTNTITARVTILPQPFGIKIIEPRNTTYYTKDNDKTLLLMFLIQQEHWKPSKTKYWTGYSLDGSPNVTVSSSIFGYFTPELYMKLIKNIPLGTHKLTVYANDSSGNSGSSTVFFTIKKIPCKNFMWFGKCPPETTTTTSTTTSSTTTIKKTTTTTISGCSGKSYSKCVSLSNCKWIGGLWTGYCTSK
jgi:hypothetical protein